MSVTRGIYKKRYGYEVRAIYNHTTRSTFFPLDTPVRTMKAWQEDQRAAIRRDRPVPGRHTFSADVASYLEKPEVKALVSLAGRTQRLLWWEARFGPKRRSAITAKDVKDGLEALAADGCGPGTITHYRMVLIALWTALDGPQAYCPAKDVAKPKAPRKPIRAIPDDTLAAILNALPVPLDAHGARILVMAHTGLPPSTLARMVPSDVSLDDATMRVPPRHKGAGVDGSVLPLTADAVAALRLWISTHAYGDFSPGALSHAFQKVCRKAGVTGHRLYDLRHTYLTRVLRLTGNIEVVKALAMHQSLATSQHYTRGAVAPLLRDAMPVLNGDLDEPSRRNQQPVEPMVH